MSSLSLEQGNVWEISCGSDSLPPFLFIIFKSYLTLPHMLKVIINNFKLRGLVLQLDALEVLQELCQQQASATEFIEKILNSIDSQKCAYK